MKRTQWLGLIFARISLVILSFSALAQEQNAQSVTRKVVIPIVAIDASESPIRGLRLEDFSDHNGRKQSSLKTLEDVGPFLLPPTGKGPGDQPVFLLADHLNPEGDASSDLVLKFLADSLSNHIRFTLLILDADGLRAIQGPATPAEILAAALRKVDDDTHSLNGKLKISASAPLVKPENSKGVEEAAELEKLCRPGTSVGSPGNAVLKRLEALQKIAKEGKSLPGRKALVWLTSSPFLYFDDPQKLMMFGRYGGFDNNDFTIRYAKAVEALNESGVSVYPIVTADLDRAKNQEFSLEPIAQATGGKVFTPGKGLSDAINKVLLSCKSYYLLTLDTGSEVKTIEWNKLHIGAAKRTDIRLYAPDGFFKIPTGN